MDEDQFWRLHGISSALQVAYQTVFGECTPGGRAVLMDLAAFCCAYAPTSTEREQGRRDVWLHIQERLLLRSEELTAIIARLTPEQRVALIGRKPFIAHSGD